MMDVRVEGLRFDRDGRVVLDIRSLLLRDDRTTAILGPNGAGKTTLLRLIAGLERVTAGRVLIGGTVVRPRERPDVAYVFQENVFLSQSVRENLDLGSRLRRVPKHERHIRTDEAARLLGITELLDRRADRLSGGEGRRVSLARALCLRARVALLDEPLGGLDPATYARLLDELPRLLGAFGSTTVLVTHDHREALRLAQDIVVIVDGRVRAAGTKDEVVSNPGAAVVAEILGYTVIECDGHKTGVRPEALRPGPGPAQFRMTVDHLIDLVDHQEVVGSIGSVRIRVPLPRGLPAPKPGDVFLLHADRTCALD
jgi:ABC-type sugar transport system ATPase subunit